MDQAAKALAPGSIVEIWGDDGVNLGTGYFNPHSLIAVRILRPRASAPIDEPFFAERITSALALRTKLFGKPHYRLIHGEADGLPGLIVDRFDDVFVVQSGTAGMDKLEPLWLGALARQFGPRAIVVKSDAPSRAHEGLKDDVRIAHGGIEGGVFVEESGVRFEIDPIGGQKTGWFFDQRDNREFLVRLAGGARVLDAYSYIGAFALSALKHNAGSALLVDSSEPALQRAASIAKSNDIKGADFRRADVFDALERLVTEQTFDIVSCDPPPFVRSRKDLETGAKAYRKLARLSAPLVAPGGILFLASCSHAISAERFQEECAIGINRAGRSARVVRMSGAAPDHPVHPMLPESAYLKALTYALD
ncbi:MAG: methyltransferase domain-containing protein [Alphaproteobacteria bacterium]|nr:methyltransferase domain-containing protein [Alphaproteobacteria bacterium]